ncbi:hypothetical protein AB0B25_01785 [Nocardia sp. NPDC049190]|uniref:hypothetical protein n=1 Tax=Nocardia sp. NPDC049190 TaxID=3155650 RepID=UPI0033F6A94E
MASDNEPIGIMHSHTDGTLSIIGADGWPLNPEETAELLGNTDDDSLQPRQRVRDVLRTLARKADRAQ